MKIEGCRIITTRRENLVRFYTKIIGLKLVEEIAEDEEYIYRLIGETSAMRIYRLADDSGTYLEIVASAKVNIRPARGLLDTGINHLVIAVDNIEEVYNRLSNEGSKIMRAITEDRYHNKIIYCADPDGNIIQLIERFKEKKQQTKKIKTTAESEKSSVVKKKPLTIKSIIGNK